jgi:hypothetical protein
VTAQYILIQAVAGISAAALYCAAQMVVQA